MTEERSLLSDVVVKQLLPLITTTLNNQDKITIDLLRNLIANIEAGNITILERNAIQLDESTVQLSLIINGVPDITLK